MTTSASQPLFRQGGPNYVHGCIDCRFLGAIDRLDLPGNQVPEGVTDVELYAHFVPGGSSAVDVAARYGYEADAVIKGSDQRRFAAPEPHLAAAAQRCARLGYLSGMVEPDGD